MLLFFSTLLRLRGAGAGLTILCVSAAALAATLVPSRASACGGVFCSNTNLPIDQKAERIIFHVDASGKVTAVIEIRYEGPASKFAWLIPVAGKPTVGVSSNTVLDRLQAASNPSYTLTNTVKGECSGFGGGSRGPFSCGPIVAASATNDFASYDGGFVETDGGVNVLEQATVGPYDYVIVSVDPKLEDPGMAAGEWLSKNGYVTNDFGTDRLRPYLEGGMNLLAFRLRKGNSSGSIRPIKLEFGTGLPSIPLRPTAVAAVNNMGILVWVLGEHRAVPLNYKSLEINDALLDWTNPAASYEALVTRAANEAGGQGFVTEMASSAPAFADTLYPEAERSAWENVSRTDWNGREGALLFELLSRYAGYDGVADALAEEVVPALGVQADELIACPACHVSASVTDIAGVDAAHLLEKFRKLVVDPVADTATLFENAAKVTRLFTTMSPDEMTLDPSFAFNASLDDVSNVHAAERIVECNEEVSQSRASWSAVLPSGAVVRGTGGAWPFTRPDDKMPANLHVRRIGTEGAGDMVTDNTAAIDAALTAHNRTVGFTGERNDGCGACVTATGHPRPAVTYFALVTALGIALHRRARRGR